MSKMLQCYNRGCGQSYDPENNTEESCRYHPGEPYFHDAYKGWTCCNKKSVDFTEFLNFKGCTLSKHSNIKPPEPEKPQKSETTDKDEVIEVRAPIAKAMKRPPIDTQMTVITPKVDDSVKKLVDEMQVSTKAATKDATEGIPIGTSCKNNSCTCSFKGAEADHGECIYHPGVPIFHEGMKYWSCCQKKTTDFAVFMAQKGCAYGEHKWVKENDDKQIVQCRHDWHQTATDVIVSIYAKKYHYAQSQIEVNPIRLRVNLVFPEQNNACYELDIELRGIIDVKHTSAHMFGTKVEITMRKAEPGSWAKLDFPYDAKLPSTQTSALTKKQDSKKNSESDDDFNLDDIDTVTRKEIEKLVKQQDWNTLSKRLKNRLAFGTAGLRGQMRAGFDSMNDLVIVQTAQGLCEYILQKFPNVKDREERGIVLGYDGRYNSKRFAELTAIIFLQEGIKVSLYSRMVATPFVPFAIMEMKCLAGVMVTASHNPKEDNGYKVYWENGAQIIPPHDKGIQESILQNLKPKESSWNLEVLNNCALLTDPYEKMFNAYYPKMKSCIPEKYIKTNAESDLRFVYTAMHGVGYHYVEEAFRVASLKPVIAVEAQRDPDPEFPTVKFPNPEEGKSSLELSIKKANETGITTILANDPDADRLACAEKDIKTGQWKVFTGNELGALLGWWSIQNYLELQPNVKLTDCYLLASTVSSKILRSMGKIDGFQFDETLTGFKWMGNRAVDLIAEGKKVLFAFEEAIGFMFSTNVLDKDGVSAACHLATMACFLKATQNITLNDKLNEIYLRYGYHCTNCSYLFCYEPLVIERIFQRLRHFDNNQTKSYPKSILDGKYKISNVRDWSAQMLTFTFENGLVITLRTSGTEPKIKYYAELCADPSEKDWQKVRETLKLMVEAVVNEFLQPDVNNLKPKSD